MVLKEIANTVVSKNFIFIDAEKTILRLSLFQMIVSRWLITTEC